MSESVYTSVEREREREIATAVQSAVCSQCKCVFMCVCPCVLYTVIHVVPLMCLCVCSLKQSVSAVVKAVESGSPNVHVCMQIIFALNTKSERQVVLFMYHCPCNRSCSLYPGISSHLSNGMWWIIRPIFQVDWLTEQKDHFKIAIATTQPGSFLVLYPSQLDLSQKCDIILGVLPIYLLALKTFLHRAATMQWLITSWHLNTQITLNSIWTLLVVLKRKYQTKCPLQTIESRP